MSLVVHLRVVAVALALVPLLSPVGGATILLDPPMVPPAPPMNVQVSEGGEGVTVTWDPPVFFGGSDNVTYRVYRDSSLVADGLDSTIYVDAASPGASAASASYYVTAVNDAGESAQMTGVCIDLSGPFVDAWACAGLAVGIVFWVIDQVL